MDIFDEAAAELGCDPGEVEGTFPADFVRAVRRSTSAVCPLCRDKFPTREAMIVHFEDEHTGEAK